MQKFLQIVIILALGIWSVEAFAYIPPAKFISEKVAKHGGSGAYTIEQDVVFTGANETLTLREIWQVDGEGLLRITVKPPKELADQIAVQNVYAGGQKYFLNGRSRQSARINEDFFEKYLYMRGRDSLLSHMLQMKILLPPPPPAKPVKAKKVAKGKNKEKDKEKDKEPLEFPYVPEANVRLDRQGGVIAYAFGVPTPVDGEPNPGFWVEQDQFFLRKFRLPSKVEVIADRFSAFARGLWLPQQRTVRWNQRSVQINVVKVTSLKLPAKNNLFSPNSLEPSQSYKMTGIRDPDIALAVDDFYQRFR